jgi:SAM-dependent methyltransferase
MPLDKSRTHWEDMGKLDPCWAILSEPGTKHGKWQSDRFFETGREEIRGLQNALEKLGVHLANDWALDFGCGVGRLTYALAGWFRNVVGIDISQSMVEQAVALNRHQNCQFLVNGSESLPFRSGQFDLVYTAIVLQHVPEQKLIRNYIAEFMRVLKTGGLLVMQLPSRIPWRRRLQARPRLYSLLRTLGVSEQRLYQQMGLHPIPMRFLPEHEVVSIIKAGGGELVQIANDHRAGPHISSRTYYAIKHE